MMKTEMKLRPFSLTLWLFQLQTKTRKREVFYSSAYNGTFQFSGRQEATVATAAAD